MKIPNFFKRTAALVLAAVSAFAMVPSGAVYAAEPGKIGSVTARVAKDSDGNPILYNGDATFEGRHVGGKGKEKYRLLVDGYSTFCIEPGASLHNGSELKQSSSAVWDALSADKKQAIGLRIFFRAVRTKAGSAPRSSSGSISWAAAKRPAASNV